MFAFTTNSKSIVCFAAALCLPFGDLDRCDAQTSDESLFAIQAPAIEQVSGRRETLKAFLPAPTASQPEQQAIILETPPRPRSGSMKTQRISFVNPNQVEEDDLLAEIKKLDESIAGDREKLDEENELDRLIEDAVRDGDQEEANDDADRADENEPATQKRPEPTVTTWSLKPMSAINASIRPVSGAAPIDQSWQLTSRSSVPLAASEKLYAWAAPNIKHNPLYFEDVALERYGQTKGLLFQPAASGLHFLKSAIFLPYYSIYDPVNSCDGPLGYCRPGTQVNCVNQRHYFGNPFRR